MSMIYSKKNNRAAMIRLWQRLGETLGAKFINQYGAVDDKHGSFETWCKCCADLTTEQIANGFKKFMRSEDTFIDVKSFRSFCLPKEPKKKPHINWQAYELYQRPALPDQREQEKAKLAGINTLAEIKQKLKKG